MAEPPPLVRPAGPADVDSRIDKRIVGRGAYHREFVSEERIR